MNDQRKFYKNQNLVATVSQEKQTAADLLSGILAFIDKNRNIKPGEWYIIQGMIRQLEISKAKHPKKVLKAMERKFENIKANYQEQR